MFDRGQIFNDWGSVSEHEKSHAADYDNGCHVDVRARESMSGGILLLICVYAANGKRISEETMPLNGDGWTLEKAVSWGTDKAERIAGGAVGKA